MSAIQYKDLKQHLEELWEDFSEDYPENAKDVFVEQVYDYFGSEAEEETDYIDLENVCLYVDGLLTQFKYD